jgi:hypothetical protein
MNAELYKVMLKTYLRIELHPRQQDLLWLQQYGTTAHAADISMQVLRTIFPEKLISLFGDITWHSRSPDHAIPDYFLWGNVTSKVYETCPANIVSLKERVLKYSRYPQGKATTCYYSLSFATAGVY